MTSIEKLLTSLGKPLDGNEYEIKNHNGEWWIDHKAIGSGEPLLQWLGKYIPQQEISDEKILDAAEEHSDSFLNRGVAMSSFARGCYWYREQLKGDA
jgi:hypothetical protein